LKLASLIACCLALALSGPARAAETVVIGAEDDWFPYSGVVDGVAQGMTHDIVRAAFAAVGIEVRFEVLPYARCMAETKAGTLVACFDTIRSPTVADAYLWPALPMFEIQYMIFARADASAKGLRARDLEGHTVAVTNGYEYGAAFDTNPRIKRVVTMQDERNFRMVLLQRAQYTVTTEENARLLFARQTDLQGQFKVVGALEPEGIFMVFSRRHPLAERLRLRFEEGLSAIIKSGQRKAIQDSWRQRLAGSGKT
jgi:polar amino acid transport system substrate-binding protein